MSDKQEKKKKEYDALVSVIVPVFNVEDYIKQCITSLLNQTYDNIEIICVDDGSTDKTLDILEMLRKRDNRIKVFRQKHKGVAAARNKAINEAKGKYISFVDSDDYFNENGYEILVEVAEENELDLIIFGGNVVGEAPEWICNKLSTRYRYYKKGTANTVVFSENSARPFLWLHFIRRDLLEKNGKIRFDENMEIGEDQLFQFSYVPKAESVMVIEDRIYNYRINRSSSIMQLYEKQRMKKFNSHIELISKVIENWKKESMFDDNKDLIFNWVINLLYWHIIFFPIPFQKELAQKTLELIYRYDPKFDAYYLDEGERENYKYLKNMAKKEVDFKEEARVLKKKIYREEYEIRETLKSQSMKLGRLITPKKDRLDLSDYKKYM